tara:strand:- start:16 stop:192 length:177 start_codon:yes stop_codon:yes gene_type:complete
MENRNNMKEKNTRNHSKKNTYKKLMQHAMKSCNNFDKNPDVYEPTGIGGGIFPKLEKL